MQAEQVYSCACGCGYRCQSGSAERGSSGRGWPGWALVGVGVVMGLAGSMMLGQGVAVPRPTPGLIGAEGGAYLVTKDSRVFHLKGNQSFEVRELPADWR